MVSEPNLKINKVVRMARAFMNERLGPIGLSSGLYYFILELYGHDCLSMQELSRAVMVDNGHTTRAVASLLRSAYVTKRSDPDDSRSYQVSLTAKGKRAFDTIQKALSDWANMITEGVTEEEISAVHRAFDTYYANGMAYFVRNAEGGSH